MYERGQGELSDQLFIDDVLRGNGLDRKIMPKAYGIDSYIHVDHGNV